MSGSEEHTAAVRHRAPSRETITTAALGIGVLVGLGTVAAGGISASLYVVAWWFDVVGVQPDGTDWAFGALLASHIYFTLRQ